MYKKYFKRFFDFLIALLSMPFILIITLVVAPIIVLDNKGSAFYLSDRRGKNGVTYKMYKFRTMKTNSPDYRNKDGSTMNSENDDRITKVGKILRKTSIDELPQLFNVLKGDMSIIGPRPTLTGLKLDHYDENLKKRIEVRPGLTGYSQAYYRNSITSEEKFKYDCYYVDNLSFMMDVKIIFQSISTILKRENIYNVNYERSKL